MKKNSAFMMTSLFVAALTITVSNHAFSVPNGSENLLALAPTASAALAKPTVGNGKMVTKKTKMAYFNEILINGNFNVTVQPGDTEEVALTTDNNIASHINPTVMQDRLLINMPTAISPTHAKLVITVKHLRKLSLKGKNNVTAMNVKTSDMNLNMKGNNNVTLQGTIKRLALTLSGNSKLTATIYNATAIGLRSSGKTTADLAGNTQTLHLMSAGKALVSANNLIANDVIIRAFGESNITVNAVKLLTVRTAGKSNVKYYGNPKVEKSALGESTVREMQKN